MNSHHSRTHDPGKVRETEVTEAFGLSDVYWDLGPSGANVVMVGATIPKAPFIGEPLAWSNLKGCWAGGFTHGCPGPLAFTQ